MTNQVHKNYNFQAKKTQQELITISWSELHKIWAFNAKNQ